MIPSPPVRSLPVRSSSIIIGQARNIGTVVGFQTGNAPGHEVEQDVAYCAEGESMMLEGLTPEQMRTLAQKIYALMLDELRIEAERHGRVFMR